MNKRKNLKDNWLNMKKNRKIRVIQMRMMTKI